MTPEGAQCMKAGSTRAGGVQQQIGKKERVRRGPVMLKSFEISAYGVPSPHEMHENRPALHPENENGNGMKLRRLG